jgi:hypothetical protein
VTLQVGSERVDLCRASSIDTAAVNRYMALAIHILLLEAGLSACWRGRQPRGVFRSVQRVAYRHAVGSAVCCAAMYNLYSTR